MIRISLLGSLRIRGTDSRTAQLPTRRGGELFAFLVLSEGSRFDHARLAAMFWPHLPATRGRRALSTELWRLAQSLAAVGLDVGWSLPHGAHGVGYLRQPDTVIDIDALGSATRAVRSTDPVRAGPDLIAAVEAGVAVYHGDLLETVYSDWCLVWRQNLRAQHTAALEFLLAAAMARRDWTAALRHGRALLAIDPLMEHVHCAVMRCHYHNGDRALALCQFAECARLLRDELDVDPMHETRRVRETILSLSNRAPGDSPRRRERADLLAQKLGLALADIGSAILRLEDAATDLRRQPALPRDLHRLQDGAAERGPGKPIHPARNRNAASGE